jgi:hypothetical protein
MNIPGSGGNAINGQSIHQEGVDEEKEFLERLSSESQPSDFFIG